MGNMIQQKNVENEIIYSLQQNLVIFLKGIFNKF